MGADLYIEKMPREEQYKNGFSTSVETGYFRDCYNDNGLFAAISTNTKHDLSWWHTVDVHKDDWFDKKGIMTVEGTKEWLKELTPIITEFENLPELYHGEYNLEKHSFIKSQKMTKKNVKEYREWARDLIKFIEKAIEKDSPIIWSV